MNIFKPGVFSRTNIFNIQTRFMLLKLRLRVL